MRFFRTPGILPFVYPSLLWKVDTDQKDLYLTFDDGPVPEVTPYVVQTLQTFNIKATFFCIGDNVRKNPEQFKKVIDGGHSVGNHTYNHVNGWSSSPSAYKENTALCQNLLPSKRLFRPPFGRIKRSQIALLNDYKIVMWDVLTFDYDKSLDSERCLNGSLKAVRPGSIIVFHDSVKAEKNLTYVLPRFIESCLSNGYSFKAL
ncbi:MAG: polysaccharide deacetylase family protein [Bacteroidota bacterium]